MESVGQKHTEWYKVEDGEWFEVDVDNFEHKCCDCGLKHSVEFRIEGDRIFMAFTRKDKN